MTRLIALLLLLLLPLHAHPVRCAFDEQVVRWNAYCLLNNATPTQPSALNSTQSMLASSIWMGAVRAAGLFPGNIFRANLFCGGSYGGTNGCGDSITLTNIGSPQVPLINQVGFEYDKPIVSGTNENSVQSSWKYIETGSSGGLGQVSSANFVAFDTQIVPNAVSSWQNDAHAAMYMTSGGTEAAYILGASDAAGANLIAMTAADPTVGQITLLWGQTGFPNSTNDASGLGLYVGTRTSSATNGVKQYHNATATGSSTSVSGDPASIAAPISIFTVNQTLVGYVFRSGHLSGGYDLGRALTAAQEAQLYDAWQRFQTLLQRQK